MLARALTHLGFRPCLLYSIARDFCVRRHVVRVVYGWQDGSGFRPFLSLHLTGPNGSSAGFGPKGWPRVFRPLFPSYGRVRNGRPYRDRWSSTLRLPLPHVTFIRAYRLRRLGGFRVARAIKRFYGA